MKRGPDKETIVSQMEVYAMYLIDYVTTLEAHQLITKRKAKKLKRLATKIERVLVNV